MIVEDRPDDAELLLLELARAGYDTDWIRVDTLPDFVAALETAPEVVICDYSLPSMTALDVLRILDEAQLEIPVIVVSGVMDEETCVTALRCGAVDYLLKDRLIRLGPAVEHALQSRRVQEELRQLDRLKGEFVATVSHELRTPLTSISGYAELLLLDAVAPAQVRMVEVIDRNSRRLLTLVEDLLTLSRVDSGALARQDEVIDLADLVDSAAMALDPVLQAARVRLEPQIEDQLPALLGNRSQLERVLFNLLSNAVKFSDPEATVTLAVARVEDDVVVQVRDTGMGIPVSEQAQVFTRFFRTEQARRQAIQGTGLGLAVVREIVERHGGSVEVQSAPGAGTTLTVTLPMPKPELKSGLSSAER